MPQYLIPKPKELIQLKGVFHSSNKFILHYSKDVEKIALMLQKDWKGELTLKQVDSLQPLLFIGSEYCCLKVRTINHIEGYTLDINEDCIAISANSYRGTYYGYTALSQLLERHDALPAVSVYDYPDLEVRGVHFDLKGSMPSVSYIKEFIRKLGRYKINTILMEYEDKFPYQAYPMIKSPDAFTPGELTEILDTARDCAMEVIPLLQCLGHVEYILRHDELAVLGENGCAFMFCPRNPYAFELFKTLADEIMAYHPGNGIFHIGADEARQLGTCPECKAYKEAHGTKELFIEHIKKVSEYVASKGKKPMLWDDMFYKEDAFDSLKLLPEGTILTLWEYFATELETPNIEWKERFYSSKEWVTKDPGKLRPYDYWLPGESGYFGNWLEELPVSEQELLIKYKYGKNFPFAGYAFPWLKKYQEYGMDVIGASAIKGFQYNSFFPEHGQRFKNTCVWAKVAKDTGIKGVISTAWSRFSSPTPPIDFWETAMYNYISSAENYWNSNNCKEETDRKFSVHYLGACTNVVTALEHINTAEATGNLNYAEAALYILEEVTNKTCRNKQYVRILINCAEFMRLELKFFKLLNTVRPAVYYEKKKDSLRLQYNAFLMGGLIEMRYVLEKWQEDSVRLYCTMMPEGQAKELVGTKVAGTLAVIDSLMKRLE